MATVGEQKVKAAKKNKIQLKDPKTYWMYLENLKLEGKPHCMID